MQNEMRARLFMEPRPQTRSPRLRARWARPLGPAARSGFEATYPFLIAKGARLLSLWIPSFGASARIASAMAEGARCP